MLKLNIVGYQVEYHRIYLFILKNNLLIIFN